MAFDFISSGKTVLQVADEALYIYSYTSSGVEFIDSVEWSGEGFEGIVSNILTRKCGRKPVLILNDMVEQHYRKEKVIKTGVGIADKASMISRKLNAAFPGYPVRAALPLKEKIKKTQKQLAADVYILAAVPNSTQYNQVMAVASKSMAPVAGFGLLPVESADMLRVISKKLADNKKRKPAKWCVFVGQHQNGGLRQIVTKSGEIALTRMTPVCDVMNYERWAAEVKQEFDATMSYLARFGYTKAEALDVVFVSESEAGNVLAAKMADAQDGVNVHTMTPHEVSQLINLRIGPQENAHFADALHAAWGAKKAKLTLPMRALKVDAVKRPRQIAAAASVLLFLGAIFLGYKAVVAGGAMFSISGEIVTLEKRKQNFEAEYQAELSKKAAVGLDVILVQKAVRMHEELEAGTLQYDTLTQSVGKALGRGLKLSSLIASKLGGESETSIDPSDVVRKFSPKSGRKKGEKNRGEPLYTTTLRMVYPSSADIEKGNNEVRVLRERLAVLLPSYDVEVQKLLKDYQYTEKIVIDIGGNRDPGQANDFVAEILLNGPYEGDE